MVAGLKTPQIDLGKFTNFVTSDTMVLVLGAIIVTPILFGVLSTFAIGRIPLLRDNVLLALIAASVVLFILSAVFSGKIRMLFLGASAGALVNAIQQTSFAQNILSRIAASTGG